MEKKVASKKKTGKKRISDSYHHGDLKKAILTKSEEILEKFGIEGLSLRDIAADLGVSHAAPYRHFPRKVDLLFTLAIRGFSDLAEEMRQAWESSDDPIERLRSAGSRYVKLAIAHPRRTELMFGGTLACESDAPAELLSVGKEAFFGLFRIVEDGRQRGVFRDEDAYDLSFSLWSTVHGFAVLTNGRQIPPDVVETRGMETILNSMLSSAVRGILR
ncbi:TetR/AcrR family transcriptional regulator [Leptospira gomenensis]|uniref:TetR/AcrR family transcriptional regulator n=1 Tax=Leptospira gomenensis TaxID=2484974 RepID=A0A5F1YDC1_9LEPT|nr:TetR/AcrR family transcriptional regulator [Leptospira gomenensis]TGK36063.1 TetR/AcrR family transcriptional regulator [Leptospira gomenensis]TGK41809.1 TetR/AcrR family transcriptional regulator [Leptospira gomenensis]TGK53334.1 TetR/AcrR family transcriptional regulator [Leptospira gomenensis]TGK64940.1 TetR/AcrR family transcriptional regulator [Leptospira gomenensis]